MTNEQKQRIHDILYSCDSREELAERIVALEELVDYMTPIALYAASEQERDRMRELGIEVGE